MALTSKRNEVKTVQNGSEKLTTSAKIPSDGWRTCIHPNGWTYFYHSKTNRVSTGENGKKNILNVCNLDNSFDVLLDSEGEEELFVNHALRYASSDIDTIQKLTTNQDLKDDLLIAYWKFMFQFPAHRPLSDVRAPETDHSKVLDSDPFHAAKKVLNFFKMDLLRRRQDSPAPFSLDQCKELLEHLNHCRESPKVNIPDENVALSALVSWILWISVKHRKLHAYGRYSKAEQPPAHEIIVSPVISWIFWLFPFGLYGHLDRISATLRMLYLQTRSDYWTTLQNNLAQEFMACNLGATVLLSSSSAFLAVPGIDKHTRTVTLISVILTLVSVMTGLYLQWQTGKIRDIQFREDVKLRPVILAILISIPFTALIWAMMLFTVAIIMYSVLGTESNQDGPPSTFGRSTWISVLVVSCIFVIIVGLTVTIFRRIKERHKRRLAGHSDLV